MEEFEYEEEYEEYDDTIDKLIDEQISDRKDKEMFGYTYKLVNISGTIVLRAIENEKYEICIGYTSMSAGER